MTAQDIFQLVAVRFSDKEDDFPLSLGYHYLPYPDRPIGIYNLPEFQGVVRMEMRDVRAWAKGEEGAL